MKRKNQIETPKFVGSNHNVLVVGDWVVDEHWVVGDHRSASSSRTGLRHSRALHKDDCSVMSLCGAGQVATILHEARSGEGKEFSVFGVGLWHPMDGPFLTEMLNPKNNVGKTPHRISREPATPPSKGRIRLFNLASNRENTGVGTTRVIRIYQQTADDLELIQRVDWELPMSELSVTKHEQALGENLKPLREIDISHILIKDLCKGVVSKKLITWLKMAFPKAGWYVSSKAWNPPWQDDLPDNKVKLLFLPQLAAWKATRTESLSWSPWLTVHNRPSPEALAELKRLGAKYENARIVALPEGMSILAPGAEANSEGYIQSNRGTNDISQKVTPMASVLFPVLVASLIDEPSKNFLNQLQDSLSFTRKWMELEVERLKEPRWQPTEDQRLNLPLKSGATTPWIWDPFNWTSEEQDWRDAFRDLGVLPSRGPRLKAEFQLWRAMTLINGYVCCVESKKKVLQRILEQGRSFSEQKRTRHKSFMLIDAPGSGKSFLVNRLARALGMRFLPFNITQMLTRHDLQHSFDTIVTTQAQDPDKPLLVFVDEINAKLDNQHVYDFFLAPLEDGIYVRSGNTFHVAPCLWIFAGTERPVSANLPQEHDRSDKASDFESRLTLAPFNLKLNTENPAEIAQAQIEKIYVGVASMCAAFPDVREASNKVLRAFQILPTHLSAREIGQFVKRFEYVQYGRVSSLNIVPEDWHKNYSIAEDLKKEWDSMKETPDSFVEIKLGRHEKPL